MNKISVKKLHTFLGHNDSIYSLEEVCEQKFLSAGGDGMVVLWNLETPDEGEVLLRVSGSIYAVKFDEVNCFLYVGQNLHGIHKIDFNSKKVIASIRLGNHQIFDIQIIKNTLWVALQSGEVVILTLDLLLISRNKLGLNRARSIEQFDNQVAIAFSDNITRIFDSESKELVYELKAHNNAVFSARYHPSGKYLISVGRDAQVKVWDASKNYLLRESIAAHLYTINHLVFRKDGRYFVTASMDKAIKLWDAYNFKLLKVLDKHRHAGHSNSVNKLLWMNYSNLLVSCSDDRTISIWEINFEE
ncbi:MAG: WD40 repeat domain-containing protein [Bacteroidota bacterium]